MISVAGIDEAVNMNTKGARINKAAIIRNTQMNISMINDWVEVFFFRFRYCAITKALSITDFVGAGTFKLQPGKKEHDAKEYDTHGACQTDSMISNCRMI